MDDLTLLVVLPITIAVVNLLQAVRITARFTTLAGKLGRMVFLFVLTSVVLVRRTSAICLGTGG